MSAAPLRIALLHESTAWGGWEIPTLEFVRVLLRLRHRARIVQIGEPVFDEELLLGEPGVEPLHLPSAGAPRMLLPGRPAVCQCRPTSSSSSEAHWMCPTVATRRQWAWFCALLPQESL